MTTVDRAQRPSTARRHRAAWRTRDILVAAVIGVVFGVVFCAWNQRLRRASRFVQPPVAPGLRLRRCGWCPRSSRR